jgi:hypothetical protein
MTLKMTGAILSSNKMSVDKKYFNEVLNRLKCAAKVAKQKDLEPLLGLRPGALATKKRRGQLPEKEIELFAIKNGISFDWVLNGEDSPPPLAPPPTSGQEPLIEQLVARTRKILSSDAADISEALAWNIKAFSRAVELEHNLKRVMKVKGMTYEHIMSEEVTEPAAATSKPDKQPPAAPAGGNPGKSFNGFLDSDDEDLRLDLGA